MFLVQRLHLRDILPDQVVKELRLHFSEKKAMALLYKLEQQTVELVKLSRQIVELSKEMQEKWSQKSA